MSAAVERRLAELAEEIRGHRGCGFEPCETCLHPVPGEGSASAEIAFVGEAPGAREDREGRPFVGPAGQLLDRLLHRIPSRFLGHIYSAMSSLGPPGEP